MSIELGGDRLEETDRSHHWTTLAAVLCFAYGVAFTLNIHPIGDGLWFWYGRLFREHHLLYSGLHLPLQPLFVLLTAWSQQIFGVGWLASKVLAVLQLLVFCVGLWLIARRIAWRDWQRAVVVGGGFMMTITADYFRFDDYHVTGYCMEVFSIYLLLRMGERPSKRYSAGASVLLGVLSGLSLSNRINDGAALFAGCAIALWFVAEESRLVLLAEFCAGAVASFSSVVLLAGDSVRDWWMNSIARAATIKGGTGTVFKGPLHLLKWQLRYSLSTRPMLVNLGLVAVIVLSLVQLSSYRYGAERQNRWRDWAAVAALAVALLRSAHRYIFGWPNLTIGVYLALLLVGVTGWTGGRMLLGQSGRMTSEGRWREVLVVILFLQEAAGATTSGNAIFELLPPVGLFVLMLPFLAPRLLRSRVQRSALVALSSVIVVSGLYFKSIHPYEWHHFLDRAMFTNRTWYRHPVYGEMYVEKDQLQLVETICSTMRQDGPAGGMLEITNPYANWFCDVPPWHDYVQTWYDTVSSATIHQLVGELKSEPPHWIVYQRSLETLAVHEGAFNRGKPLAHRDLDRLIVDRVASGQWVIAYWEYFEGADWYVIQTDAAKQGGSKH